MTSHWPPDLPNTLEQWVVLILLVGLFIAVGTYMMNRRQRSLDRVAQELGFSFSEHGVIEESEGFLALPLLEQNTGLSNVMRGTAASGDVVILDCQIGTSETAYIQTVACLRLAERHLPEFQLRREKVLHKVATAFGYQDIDFHGNPGFSRSYLLRGQDEPAVRALFHLGVLTFFAEHGGWNVEGAGEWLAVYKPAIAPDPPQLKKFVDEATEIALVFSGKR